jgi:hydrogenase maturation protein HypF
VSTRADDRTASPGAPRALRVDVHGTVQGVGFRPFVYRLATELRLRGDVRNAGGHVVARVAGRHADVEAFLARLTTEAPPQSAVNGVTVATLSGTERPDGAFTIADSDRAFAGSRCLPPDLATCAACLRELFDPADRRYRYPFLNCTDCGPRATIVGDLPYDRARTAMRQFPMCGPCAEEYADPGNRRFHAEPTACPDCGPRLRWSPTGETGPCALARAEAVIAGGGLVALKGIGGYQLVCAADADAAVHRLRAAKSRPRKPFAVMAADLTAAGALVAVDERAAALLSSAAAPIVLLPRRSGAPVATSVAPGLPDLGVFLPNTPLHHLLMADLAMPLIVTSGNRGGEPIATTDEHAAAALGPFVDGVLAHDRPVWSRYDDSVCTVTGGSTQLVRRARGYSPAPLPLPSAAPEPLLAVGAQLKCAVTLGIDEHAVTGPHLGDLSDVETHTAFLDSIAALSRLHDVDPAVVAHDVHPGYLSTGHARRWPAHRRIAVQHHHAHVAATAAEHGVATPFLGLAYDGLGLGDDGTLWGGELLLCDYTRYRRLGRFGTAPLPGGEAAVRNPARMALGYLFGAEDSTGLPEGPRVAELLERVGHRRAGTIRRMIGAGINCPRASSAGRLFDAVAALLGLCDEASYEGEAAVLLEAAARRCTATTVRPLRWDLRRRDGLWVYDHARTLADAADGPPETVALRFHHTLVEVTLAMVTEAAREHGVRTVCLGGGVFQNRLLSTALLRGLAEQGFDVHIGRMIPVNDGGISYGQAVVAAARLHRG